MKKGGRRSKIYASSLLLLPLKNFLKQHPPSYPPKNFYVKVTVWAGGWVLLF